METKCAVKRVPWISWAGVFQANSWLRRGVLLLLGHLASTDFDQWMLSVAVCSGLLWLWLASLPSDWSSIRCCWHALFSCFGGFIWRFFSQGWLTVYCVSRPPLFSSCHGLDGFQVSFVYCSWSQNSYRNQIVWGCFWEIVSLMGNKWCKTEVQKSDPINNAGAFLFYFNLLVFLFNTSVQGQIQFDLDSCWVCKGTSAPNIASYDCSNTMSFNVHLMLAGIFGLSLLAPACVCNKK